MQLLTKSNVKIEKSKARGYITSGIHLAPGNLSGFEVCRGRSPGCTESCLNETGHGVLKSVQRSRILKTQLLFTNRHGFMEQLFHEVHLAVNYAARKAMQACFRLNLTSDQPWETMRHNGKTIMEAFPNTWFYDYTKIPQRVRQYLAGKMPENYHLTFSRSESNQKVTENLMSLGANVAVVFHKVLPATYLGRPVVNGDADDLRFLDPANVVVGLVSKGKAKKDESGFVIY